MRFWLVIIVLCSLFLYIGCQPREQSLPLGADIATESVLATEAGESSGITASGVSIPSSLDIEGTHDPFASFPLARPLARAWHPDAVWYGIAPFTSLEWAIALPADQPAWVYRFGTPDGAREYLVQIIDGQVTGAMEFPFPDYIEPGLQRLEPIDAEAEGLLDSESVRAVYLAQEGNLLAEYPDMLLDYRLAHLRECGRPVWMLIDAARLAEPIFVMDAQSGEVVTDPLCRP